MSDVPESRRKRTRCAIYTRKSTDEGLDQAFNSLDAQREACLSFIESQKHEGWTSTQTLYDDGGYSGGNLERPALRRLLADIEAGRIDAIVVYKVDRLTRALSDFAKLVEIFDRRGVSFVSITQQFNTTTSMGRLTLNVLLSFAQFEREVISERVRDKIAASKQKGMWMGGNPPLGYDVKDRKLVINEEEAQTVVGIFRRYLQTKSVHALKDDLAGQGIVSKRRLRADGSTCGGKSIARGALYSMLQNRLYRGEVTHKGRAYPGEHLDIIDEKLWSEVQDALAENRVDRSLGRRANESSLLAGLLYDGAGARLTPSHAVKKGKRYRYYVSTGLITGAAANGLRLPASDLEAIVLDRLGAFLSDPGTILDFLGHDGANVTAGLDRARKYADDIRKATTSQRRDLLLATGCRVIVRPDRIDIEFSRVRLAALLLDRRQDPEAPRLDDKEDPLTLSASAKLMRVRREMKLVVPGRPDDSEPDPHLLKLLARAHDIQNRLSRNAQMSVHDVAASESLSAAYIYTLLRLRWLAPDITAAIIEGRQPRSLSAMSLIRVASRLPGDWAEQRELLGFGGPLQPRIE